MFPFGVSIGDFIAIIETVVITINALKDATGAAAEYCGVVRELESLKTALECVDRLEVANQDQIEGLKYVAANASQTILEYLGRLKKHEPSLRSGSSIQKWRDGLRKIQWSLYTKDDIRRFQVQLQSHVASLNVLMSQIIMSSATAAHNNTKTALIRIEAKVDQGKVTQLMVQAVIVSALARCWEEFHNIIAMILMTNFQVFDTILGLSRMPRQVEFDKPITFEDAHNRLFPLNIQWLDTWEHFETVLKWKFSNVPGLQKIEIGEYVLHDVFSKADIVRSGAIEKALRPGRRINMSMIFKLQGSKQAMCPKCRASVLELPRSDTNCENCGLCYRRVEPLRTENLGPVTETEVIPYQTAAPQPAIPGQASIGPPEDQISDFARVRILNIPKMKALEHMKQELAELNRLRRHAREVHKPAFGDLEIADAEVESQHKDPALKAVGRHEDKGLEDKTIANLNFAFRTSANCKTVHLLGSWDNYTGQLPLSKDPKKAGGWVGNFKFQGITLKQGRRYWYYYIIDGYHVSHDPAKEFTTEPTTGRKLNVLDVPGATSGSAAAPASRTSATSSNSTKRHSRRVSSDIPKGRALSPSKIVFPTPIKPNQARQIVTTEYEPAMIAKLMSRFSQATLEDSGDSEFDSNGDSDVPSLTSRSPNSSCPSSVSSGSVYCSCERYAITRSGERFKLNCGGARCGYDDDYD